VITLRGVRHAFAGRTVLDGVDLHLPEERVGVVGANG
jgi:ATPase subunit of ABC transporter with duplicated ATPase domains